MRLSLKTNSNSDVISRHQEAIIDKLMGFLQLQARVEDVMGGNGGFANVLCLSATTTTRSSSRPAVLPKPNDNADSIRANQISFTDSGGPNLGESGIPTLVFRYELPVKRLGNAMKMDGGQLKGIHLSTLTSILDEVTTLGMIAATLPSGSPRPGVSVTMATQWGPGGKSLHTNNNNSRTIDIVTTITKKGQNLGFIRAEVLDPITGEIICYFQHTKYLPVGWLMGIVLSPVGKWGLSLCSEYLFPMLKIIPSIKKPSKTSVISTSNSTADDNFLHSFRMTSESTAIFEVEPQHTNGFGGLHGGVQSMLMERLGQEVAKQTFLSHPSSHMTSSSPSFDGSSTPHKNYNNISIHCDRLQISYQSSASKFVMLQAFVMMTDDPLDQQRQPQDYSSVVTIRIVIVRASGQDGKDHGKKHVSSISSSILSTVIKNTAAIVVSEGILSFVVSRCG
jgi:hypothetical protein